MKTHICLCLPHSANRWTVVSVHDSWEDCDREQDELEERHAELHGEDMGAMSCAMNITVGIGAIIESRACQTCNAADQETNEASMSCDDCGGTGHVLRLVPR